MSGNNRYGGCVYGNRQVDLKGNRTGLKQNLVKIVMTWIAVLSFSTLISFGNCNIFPQYTLLKAGSIVTAVVVAYEGLSLFLQKKYMPSKALILIEGMYSYIALVTLINGYNPFRRGFIGLLFMPLAFDIVLYQKDILIFRNSIRALNTLVVLNFISILLFHSAKGIVYYTEEGVRKYDYYLLGIDNGHIIMLLPVICINFMIFMRTQRKRYLVLAGLPILGIYITFSATTIMMIVFMVLLYAAYILLPKLRKIIFNKNVLVIALAEAFIFFILSKGYDYFSAPLNYFFHKDVGYSRAAVYQISIDYIKEQWLFGYGYVIDKTWIGGYNSSHNIFLDFLLAGGVIALVWFLGILYVTFHKGEKEMQDCRESSILFCAVIAFVLAHFTEGYDTYVSFYLFYCLCLLLGNGDAVNEFLNSYERRS